MIRYEHFHSLLDEQSIQAQFVHRAEFDLAMTYKQIKGSKAEQFYACALRLDYIF